MKPPPLDQIGLLSLEEAERRKHWRAQPKAYKEYSKGSPVEEVQQELALFKHPANRSNYNLPLNTPSLDKIVDYSVQTPQTLPLDPDWDKMTAIPRKRTKQIQSSIPYQMKRSLQNSREEAIHIEFCELTQQDYFHPNQRKKHKFEYRDFIKNIHRFSDLPTIRPTSKPAQFKNQ